MKQSINSKKSLCKNRKIYILKVTCLFFLVLFILPQTVSSQNESSTYDIKWGNNQKVKSVLYEQIDVLKNNDGNMYFFQKLRGAEPIFGIPTVYELVEKYNPVSDQLSSLSLKLKTDEVSRTRINVLFINDTIHIISYFNNKSKDAIYIFDESIDMNTFTFKNDIHKIAEIKYDETQIKNSNNVDINFRQENRERDNKYSLQYSYESKKGKIIGFELFDNKLDSLVEYQNITDVNIEIQNYVFDNNNNLYTTERFLSANGFPSGDLKLVYYPNDGASTVKRSLDIYNKFIVTQALSLNANNQVVCSGLYALQGSTFVSGAFGIIFKSKLPEIEAQHTIDFSQDILNKGMKTREANKIKDYLNGTRKLEDPYICAAKNIHFNSDGSFYLIAYESLRESVYDGAGKGSHYEYTYGDIFVLNFNVDGSNKWNQKIYRDDLYQEGLFHTHFLGEFFVDYGADNNVKIIFNRYGKSLNTYLATFNSDGTNKESVLISDKKTVKTLCPNLSMNCGDNNYLLTKINYLSVKSFLQGFNPAIYNFNVGKVKIK